MENIKKNERTGITLRISVTDHCNLRCLYCRPNSDDGLTRGKHISLSDIAVLADCLNRSFGLKKIHLTGGEPLLRPDLEHLIAKLADMGVPDLAMTTNAGRLAAKARALKLAGLRRVNISLDSLSSETFRSLSRGGKLRDTLKGLDAAAKAGLAPLKINTVIVRNINDAEIVDLLEFAMAKNCELRFIELMPIGPGAMLFEDGFISSAEVRRRLTQHFDLQPLGSIPGSSSRRYQVSNKDGRLGTVGFISSCSQPFCGDCSRLRLTADGRLIGCLAVNGGISIRDMLRCGDAAAITAAVREVMLEKQSDRIFKQEKTMASIGG